MLFVAALLAVAQVGALVFADAASAITPTPADTVYARGTAGFFGSPGSNLAVPVSGIARTTTGNGYWVVDRTGMIRTYGDASYMGQLPSYYYPYNPDAVSPTFISALAAHPTSPGYWMATNRGGVYNFGAAQYYGSVFNPSAPIVAIMPTPTGNGYRMIGTNGGVYTFGQAQFYGSLGAASLSSPIVGGATTPSGNGYWLLAANGTVYPFGNATSLGNGVASGKTFVAMIARPAGGYWLIAKDGTILNIGGAAAMAAASSAYAMVAAAATPDGNGVWVASTGVPPPGAIAGTVKTGTTAVPGICVTGFPTQPVTYDHGSSYWAPNSVFAVTTITGYYRLENLRSPNYRVFFQDCTNGFYVPRWYTNAADYQSATPVPVVPAQTSTANMVLSRAGAISGTVETANGQRYDYGCVTAYNSAGVPTGVGMSSNYITSSYRIGGLPPGAYKLSFTDCGYSGEVLPVWSGNVDNQAVATAITVVAGAVTDPVDAMMPFAGSIAGVIKGSNGLALPSACVQAIDTRDGSAAGVAVASSVSGYYRTSITGYYRIPGLRTGSYLVNFSDCGGGTWAPQWGRGQTSESAAQPFAVTAGSRTTANATLAKSSTISGVVRNPATTPIPGVCVSARTDDPDGANNATATTTVTGYYVLRGLAATGYRVQFNNCGVVNLALDRPWWNAKATETASDLATPPAAANLPNINAVVRSAGSISGIVKNASNVVQPGVCVSAWDSDGSKQVGQTRTTVTGFYRIGRLNASSYKVRFGGGPCSTSTTAVEWWHDQPAWSSATPVVVASGADTPNISPIIGAAGALSGVVSTPAGVFAGAKVTLLDGDDIAVADPVMTTVTGYYRFGGLNTGGYRVQVDPPVVDWDGVLRSTGLSPYLSPAPIAVPVAGSATSNVLLTVAVPSPPTGVSATAGNTKATVSWTAPVNEGTSPLNAFIVTATTATLPQRVVTVAAPTTSLVMTGLTNSVAYTFTVQAVNFTGQSAASSPSAAVTPDLTAMITPPATTTGAMTVMFSDTVHAVTKNNVGIRAGASTTTVASTLTCANAAAAAVSCATGAVHSATVQPSAPLTTGTSYTAVVNPAGVTPTRDFAGNAVKPNSVGFTFAPPAS